jgi:hypothetical protein
MAKGKKMKIHSSNPPESLFLKLEQAPLKYTDAVSVFHIVWLGSETYCGVFGDGDNALYEWFFFEHGKLTTSDSGYGCSGVALRHALVEAEKAGWL